MQRFRFMYHSNKIALLFIWSAILLCSCGRESSVVKVDKERLMTQQSDSLVELLSERGEKSRRVFAMKMERYEFAAEPYTEFRSGVNIITYDSLGNIDATLVADYAIQLERQKLWEARGNVVVVNSTRDTLETQQLFWNQRRKLIYSNVDSKVTLSSGDIQIGTGFESDEEFKDWVFRGSRGKFLVDETEQEDAETDTHIATEPAAQATITTTESNQENDSHE